MVWTQSKRSEIEGLLKNGVKSITQQLQQRVTDLMASREESTLKTPQEVIIHIQEIHADIRSLPLKSIEHQKSSSDDALPV